MKKNYYQILQIKNDANDAEIEQAYQRAFDRLKQSGVEDPDTQALLTDAYFTLSDATNRATYDQSLSEPAAPTPRLRNVAIPPSMDFPIDESHQEKSSVPPRRFVGIGIALAAMVVTIFVGYLLMGKSRAPDAPAAAARNTVNTSSIPVSSEPLSSSQAPAPSAEKAINTGPRSGDQVFAEVSNSIVRIVVMDDAHTPIGGGSGVVTARGTVITNCHVALKGSFVEVRAGKDSFPANVALADETFDLCQLTVGGGFSAPAVEIGGMQYVRTGQKVFAIGAPQGLDLTISEGIVSSLRETKLGTILQTTAPISPGSSGGGLFNISGQLIGITTFQLRSGQNLNFAVPADWIAEMSPRGGPGPNLQ